MLEIPGFELGEFGKFALQNRNNVILVLETTTIWKGKGGARLAQIGPWELAGERFDKPARELGDRHQRRARRTVIQRVGGNHGGASRSSLAFRGYTGGGSGVLGGVSKEDLCSQSGWSL